METLSIQLKPDTIAILDQLRQQNEFKPPRSMYIRSLIERHVAEVTAIADSEGPKPK
jgi:predicted DNA-binding protein